jgi:NAD(P)-dependent dehydrogenase (short-subunit alcohol dehydrogenase family)
MSVNADRQVAVITGASAGIGKSTARMLAERGWDVICVGRDPARSAAAEQEIRAAAAPGAQVDLLRGDFTEMKDVRRIAGEIMARTKRIDVLINNAGGVRDKLYVTSENIEAMFAANHLAPFLLTRELMPLLKATAASTPPGTVRVIAVSSSGHMACQGMNWDDLNMFGNFTTGGAYCQAKLANILFTRELARRAGGDGIIAQSMHPGRVKSNFASHGDQAMQTYMENAESIGPDEPARTLVWLATADEAGRDAGRYFHDMQDVAPASQALDDEAARRLWQESEIMLGRILGEK